MKQKIYWLVSGLHILCYILYHNKIREIDEDLIRFSGGHMELNPLSASYFEKNTVLHFIIDYHSIGQYH